MELLWISSILLGSIHVITSSKSVDVLSSGGLNSLEEDEILRVISHNKTELSKNITFVELISNLRNHSDEIHVWREDHDVDRTNPYYENFTEQVNRDVYKLLQIVPAYNPGAGMVSVECKRHSEIYQRELEKFTLWALKMYDATAKIPSGLLNGNVNQFGDFDECIGIEGSEGIRGQYCLAHLQLDIDQSRSDLKHIHRLLHSHYIFKSNLTDPGHRVPRFNTVNWAICVPAVCSSRDVEASLRHTVTKHTARTGLKITVKVDQEMCQVQNVKPFPTETIVVGLFFIGITTLTIIAAICDHYGLQTNEILLSFSLKRNFKKLVSLERSDGDIATLHGIRALNAILLVMAHKCMALFFNPYVNRTEMSVNLGKSWTVIGRAASLYTDPFILLSGLLTTYSFVGRLNRTGKLNVRNEYFSRLMRLIPTLAALILFCTFIMPFIGSGPQWNLVVTHHAIICKKTWWRNFLFIHNYFGFENMCLTHTHHLGIDTQLFALSPLLVLLLWKRPKIGAFILIVIAIFSTILRFSITYYKRLNNFIAVGTSIKQLFDTANFSYILPSHRITIYIMGIFAGYLLRNCPRNYKMNGTVICVGWLLTTLMFLASFLGPAKMGTIDYVYNPIHAAIYNAFAPIGWCALFIWIIFLYHTGNTNDWLSRFFAWKGFLISTRLSYAIYLTQFPVFFYNVGRTRSPEYHEFFRLLVNLKELLAIIVTAMILTLLFDTPFQNIRSHFIKRPKLSTETKISKLE